MGPIDYTMQVRNPVDSLLGGLKTGMELRQFQDARDEQQRIKEQQQLALQEQNKFFSEFLAKPNKTGQDYADAMIRYPHLADNMKKSFDLAEPERQKNILEQASLVHAAALSGKHEIAVDMIKKQKEAAENSGDTKRAAALDAMLKTGEASPQALELSTGMFLNSVLGVDKYAQNFGNLVSAETSLKTAPATVKEAEAKAKTAGIAAQYADTLTKLGIAKTKAETNKILTETKNITDQYNLDRDKFMSEFQLKMEEFGQKTQYADMPSDVKTLVNESVQSSILSGQMADEASTLADQIESNRDELGGWKGINTVGEWLKSQFGSQDEITALRQRYSKLTTQSNLAQYKKVSPGPQTDKDAEIAMKGVPSDTANPQAMVDYLRAMARIQRFDATYGNAKSEWVASVGSLGKTKRDIEVDGVEIPAGSTFNDFASVYLKQKAEEQEMQKRQEGATSRGYMGFAKKPVGGAGGSY